EAAAQKSPSAYDHVGVVGAGAWGTALAMVAARDGRPVSLWAREEDVVASVGERRENTRFLPGISLPPSISATADLAAACDSDVVLVVVPAQHLRPSLRDLRRHLRERTPVVLCAKGIETGTGKLLTEILAEEAPEALPAILSGPSFARDVAR